MKPSSRNDVLQLQSRLQTPHQLAEAAGGYAKTEWNFEKVLRKTLAGQEFLDEETANRSGVGIRPNDRNSVLTQSLSETQVSIHCLGVNMKGTDLLPGY